MSARRSRSSTRPLAPSIAKARSWLPRLSPTVEVFLVTRALLLLACYLGLIVDPLTPHGTVVIPLHGGADPWRAFPGALLLDGWVRWDSGWYHSIIDKGYSFTPGQQCNIAFFPLYPFVCAVVALPLRLLLPNHQAFYLAALVVSHFAFFAALKGFQRLAQEIIGAHDARRALRLMCVFPYALFFCAAYTEALYLALVIWAIIEARRARWTQASILAALASATRSTGVLLTPLFVLQRLRETKWQIRRLARSGWPLLIAPLGMLAFMTYQWLVFGDPLAFVHIQSAWNRSQALPSIGLMWQVVQMPMVSFFSRLDILLQIVLIFSLPLIAVLAWRRCGRLLGAWTVASLVPPLLSGSAAGLGRYTAAVFPLFLGVAPHLRRRWVLDLVILISLALQLTLTHGFSHWSSPT